jgi:hypothetical protein
MTCCVFNRTTKEIGADTQNTTDGSTITRVRKIEILPNGWWFLGSGHAFTIAQCRKWASASFDPEETPDWDLYLEDTDEFAFGCLAIDPITWKVRLLDGELVPTELTDGVVGVGSGSAWAIAALEAGATMTRALEIAGEHDAFTSAPYEVMIIG